MQNQQGQLHFFNPPCIWLLPIESPLRDYLELMPWKWVAIVGGMNIFYRVTWNMAAARGPISPGSRNRLSRSSWSPKAEWVKGGLLIANM